MKIRKKFIGIVTGFLALCMVMICMMDSTAYADENSKKYEYGEDGVVNEALELKIDATAGKNYDVTIRFTGVTQENEIINLGYDNVTNDQMVENVHAGNDRSGLIGETVKEGVIEERTFSVAAIEDSIVIKANGSGKILSVDIKEKQAEKRDVTTIFTIGDSLVQTYNETYAPQTGWGQTLQNYFDEDKVVVENHALGGRSSGSFMREGRLNEVLVNINPGDYVLIEFGHNDASKQKEDRYVSVEDYKVLLKEQYIRAVEQRGGIPVLVTLVNRNDYDKVTGQFNVSFARYVNAMKEVAAENNANIIDLNAKTVAYFTQLNKTFGIGITEAVIFNYAEPGEYSGAYSDGVADNTHLQEYGAKIVAGMVAEGLCRELNLEPLSLAYIEPDSHSGKPETPTGLKMKGESWVAGKIEWQAVKEADFYKVYVAEVKNGETGEYELAGYSASNEFSYADITIFKSYMFKVVAMNMTGESEESEEFLFVANDEASNQNSNEGVEVISKEVEKDEDNMTVIVVTAVIVFLVAAVIIGFVAKKKR